MFWNHFRECTSAPASITFPISGLVATLRAYLGRKPHPSKVIEVLIRDWLESKSHTGIDSPLSTPAVNLADTFYRRELGSAVGTYSWSEFKKIFNIAAERYIGESIDSSGWWLEHSAKAMHITYRRIFVDQKLKTLDDVLEDIRSELVARGVTEVEFTKYTHDVSYKTIIPPDGNYDKFLKRVSDTIFEKIVHGRQNVHSRASR